MNYPSPTIKHKKKYANRFSGSVINKATTRDSIAIFYGIGQLTIRADSK